MTTDNFRVVLYNDGEEIVPNDLIDNQTTLFSRLTDQVLETLIAHLVISPSPSTSTDVDFWGQDGDEPRKTAYCITPGAAYLKKGSANHKISLGRGTLIQKIGNQTGATPTFLPFTFGDNTTSVADLWTLTNGDATNPRIDLLQMSLSLIDDTLTSRVSRTLAVKSLLDLDPPTGHVNTVVRAKVGGKGGDAISISLTKRTSGTGVTYSESGNTISIVYQDGVSTVANLEAAITASSTLIEIASAGTPGNVLSDPADSFVSTHLAGGVDSLVVTTSFNKRRRVQAVFSVKVGTPAVNPLAPTPDSGACVVGAVLVGNGWTTGGNAPVYGIDGTVANNAYIHDHRMPVGVRGHRVDPSNFKLVTNFSRSDSDLSVTATNGTNDLYVPCPVNSGRLVGVGVYFGAQAAFNSLVGVRLGVLTEVTIASFVVRSVIDANVTTAPIFLANTEEIFPILFVEQGAIGGAVPNIPQGSPFTADPEEIRPPIWANGHRCARPKWVLGGGAAVVGIDQLAVNIHNVVNGTKIGAVTFYIAEGL